MLLGWGPANTRTAVAVGATPEEREEWGRNWGDAHNLLIETFATTGMVGLLALVALLAVLVARAWRRIEPTWALVAAVTLGLFALYEPLNVVTTPLLFLTLGLAAARAPARIAHLPGAGRVAVSVLLVGALLSTGLLLAAATLERWGSRYGEIWALESALDLQPWRLNAQRALAFRLSADASAGDETAARRAREVIDDAVGQHPWHPQVRLWAGQVEHLMRDEGAAIAWVEQHEDRFPSDAPLVAQVRRVIGEGGFTVPEDITSSS